MLLFHRKNKKKGTKLLWSIIFLFFLFQCNQSFLSVLRICVLRFLHDCAVENSWTQRISLIQNMFCPCSNALSLKIMFRKSCVLRFSLFVVGNAKIKQSYLAENNSIAQKKYLKIIYIVYVNFIWCGLFSILNLIHIFIL